ncbi:MAG: IS5 family transposase [Chlamydiales bacterium]|nr:IS5 family transposase [Chlamydiales bacterium]MCP5490402.1 IS5 family transposase [Chlamydiales bacterium]MCP5490827.1 IS5 family transposase [Chlamydiales bacterium]
MRKRNWHKYNRDLVKRGSITFFIDPNALTEKPEENKRGRPRLFSLPLIYLLLVLKIQYRLTYRTLEGFAKSILPHIEPDIFLPTYSLICKRASHMEALLPKLSSRRPKVVLLDTTGIKVYGEGEWKVKMHGASKRRKWVKLHIAIDENTQEIIHFEITKGHEADCKIGPKIIEKLPKPVETVIADGGYDTKRCREAINQIGAKDLIPPRKNSLLSPFMTRRNNALREIKGLGGDQLAREIWGKLTRYSRRALVETSFSRLKRLYGERFFSKKIETQKIEGHIKCKMLNQMLLIT